MVILSKYGLSRFTQLILPFREWRNVSDMAGFYAAMQRAGKAAEDLAIRGMLSGLRLKR